MSLYALRPKIREAIYLWLLLGTCVPDTGDQWLVVANGNGVSDEELAMRLDIPAATARKWRKKLEAVGAIRTTQVGPRTRRFELFNFAAQPAEEKPHIGLVN
jgi:predicted ArsR family transcriptional regulator